MERKETICPVCEKYTFEFPDDYDICPICGWENDGLQRVQNDYWGGANELSVNESKLLYSLLHNENTKSKVSKIIEKHNLRRESIYIQYADIDYTTIDGEKCHKALSQAHEDFITELNKVLENR